MKQFSYCVVKYHGILRSSYTITYINVLRTVSCQTIQTPKCWLQNRKENKGKREEEKKKRKKKKRRKSRENLGKKDCDSRWLGHRISSLLN